MRHNTFEFVRGKDGRRSEVNPSAYGTGQRRRPYSCPFERGELVMPDQEDIAAACEHVLGRADSMLNASISLIEQARVDDAREQIFRAYWLLTEAIESLQALLL